MAARLRLLTFPWFKNPLSFVRQPREADRPDRDKLLYYAKNSLPDRLPSDFDQNPPRVLNSRVVADIHELSQAIDDKKPGLLHRQLEVH